MFSGAKDAFTSRAVQALINQRIARYGEVRSLQIDTRARSIELVCQLHGEPAPFSARIANYEIADSGDRKVLRLSRCVCTADRPWLQHLLEDLTREREIPLPPWAASAL